MDSAFYQGVMDSLPSGYTFLDSAQRPEFELLLLLRKFCTNEAFLFTKRQGGEVYQYYQKTVSMLDEELKHDCVTKDSLYLIMSNLMLVAANRCYLTTKKRNESSSMFLTYDQDSKYLIKLIDNHWKVEKRSWKAQEHKKIPYVNTRKLIKRIIISGASLLGIGSIGSTVYFSQLEAEVKRLSTQKIGFFQRISVWWNQTLWHKPVEESDVGKQANLFRSLSMILWYALGLMFLLGLLLWLYDRWIQKCDTEAEVDRLQFQFLRNVGITVDKCLKEDYSGWN